MIDAPVLVNSRRDLTVLTINRPEARGALTIDMGLQLLGHLEACASRGDKVVVLASNGPAFCAGADFSLMTELAAMEASEIQSRIYGTFQGLVRHLMDAPFVTVAHVNGPAVGAGFDLALACDLRVSTRDAVFQQGWVRLGLVPGMGGMASLSAIVGVGRAMEATLSGRPVGADEALRWGITNAVVANLEEALAWISPMMNHDAEALRAIKRGIRHGSMPDIQGALDRAAANQAIRLTSSAVRDRIHRLIRRKTSRP